VAKPINEKLCDSTAVTTFFTTYRHRIWWFYFRLTQDLQAKCLIQNKLLYKYIEHTYFSKRRVGKNLFHTEIKQKQQSTIADCRKLPYFAYYKC